MSLGVFRRIVLQLQGGFGNQLFQLATGLSIARERQATLVVDRFSYLRPDMRDYALESFEKTFGFKSTVLGRVYFRPFKLVTEQQEFGEFSKPVTESPILKIRGYFQNPTIAPSSIRDISSHLNSLKREYESDFCNCSLNHVGVHIRRGDYLSIKANASNFGVLSDNYYLEAMNSYDVSTSHFVLYSEDEIDVTKYFPDNISITNAHSPKEPRQLLIHMIQNEHFIMSNSSLSWWAAKCIQQTILNSKIVSPSTWFRGYPQSKVMIDKEWTTQPAQWIE
jgi:hypothetical protein